MSNIMQAKLDTSCILTVPFQIYEKDFTFIVNGEEFKTNRLIASLISPKISKMQTNDPTISQFTIETQNKGNFQPFLNLINFQQNHFQLEDIPFIEEVVGILGSDYLSFVHPESQSEITTDNVFDQIIKHISYPNVNSQLIQEDIELIASQFYQINQDMLIEKFEILNIDVIRRILTSPQLMLKSEDQLVSIINELYLKDPDFSVLYEYVNFEYISEVKMFEFLSIFNIDDLTNSTWKKISNRLLKKVLAIESIKGNRYFNVKNNVDEVIIQIPSKGSNQLDGIIRYISSHKNSNYIEITSSPFQKDYNPKNAIMYNDIEKGFSSPNENAFICFNFKGYRAIPTSYTIRSWNSSPDSSHPKGWVIEGSNDNNEFEILDEQHDCSLLNGNSLVCTFTIDNPQYKKYQYLRMRRTQSDWLNSNNLDINSIEFNGGLIVL